MSLALAVAIIGFLMLCWPRPFVAAARRSWTAASGGVGGVAVRSLGVLLLLGSIVIALAEA